MQEIVALVYNWLRMRESKTMSREDAARLLGENVRTLDDYLWRISWGLDHSFDFMDRMHCSIGALIKAQKRACPSGEGSEGSSQSSGSGKSNSNKHIEEEEDEKDEDR